MKKRMYLFIALFMGASGLYAQDCAIGYCPSTITVHHKAGDVSPVGGDMTYSVVKVGTGATATCWITQNLGATSTPSSASSNGTSVDGWLWQVNRKQGFVFGTWTLAVPSTSISFSAGATWDATQDPCTILLGSAWHIPTSADYTSIGFTWPNSGVKLNDSPEAYMNGSAPTAYNSPGASGYYHTQDYAFSGTSTTRMVSAPSSGSGSVTSTSLAVLLSVRCVKLESK